MLGYSRVPNPELPSNNSTSDSNRGLRFGRARLRWTLIALATLTLLLLLGLVNSHDQKTTLGRLHYNASPYLEKLFPSGKASNKNTYSGLQGGKDKIGQAAGQMGSATSWVQGSGRQNLNYSTPFNQDDLTLTEDECDAFFPGLYKEVDRSVQYFKAHP